MPGASSDLKNFSLNAKKTALGVRFGKKLFSDPKSLDPKQITQIMKMLGLNIPQGVLIAQDAAQVLMSGQAVVDSYKNLDDLKTAESLGNFCQVSASSLQTINMIASRNGWVDQNTSKTLYYGTMAMRLFASGGTDVSSWVTLAMDVSSSASSARMKSDQLARREASDWLKSARDSEYKNILENMTDMNSGKIGIFGFLAKCADSAPLSFESVILSNPALKSKMPGLNFVPVYDETKIFNQASTTWYGSSESGSFAQTFRTIGDMNEVQAKEFIFKYVIEPYAISYFEAESTYAQLGKGSIINASLLALIKNDPYIDFTQDMSQLFLDARLTPSEIGDRKTFIGYNQRINSSAISGTMIKSTQSLTQSQAQKLDESGMIQDLLADDAIKKYLRERYTFDKTPFQQSGAIRASDFRKVSNIFACLDFLDMARLDPYYKNGSKLSVIEKYNGFQKIQDFKASLQKAYNLSCVRAVNSAALGNVSYFLNAPSSSLKLEQNFTPGQPAIFK